MLQAVSFALYLSRASCYIGVLLISLLCCAIKQHRQHVQQPRRSNRLTCTCRGQLYSVYLLYWTKQAPAAASAVSFDLYLSRGTAARPCPFLRNFFSASALPFLKMLLLSPTPATADTTGGSTRVSAKANSSTALSRVPSSCRRICISSGEAAAAPRSLVARVLRC